MVDVPITANVWFSRPVELSRASVPRLQALGSTRVFAGLIAVARDTLTLWKCTSASAGSSTWEPLVGDWDARAFGPVVTNSVIQLALDSCAAAGGGVVVLPAGEFAIETELAVGARTTLRGVGRATRLIGTASPSNGDAVISVSADDVTIEHLAIEGQHNAYSPAHSGVRVYNAARCRIDRVHFAGYSSGLGLTFAVRSHDDVTHDDIEITRCRIEDAVGEGIFLEGAADGYHIERVRIATPGADGVRMQGAHINGRVLDCTVTDTGGRGVTIGIESAAALHPTRRVIIDGNIVDGGGGLEPDMGVAGLGQAVRVSGNIIDNYAGDGINTKIRQGMTALNIVQNVVPWEGAIKAKGSYRGDPSPTTPGYGYLIIGNSVYNVPDRGIHCSAGEATVVGNVVEKVEEEAIEFQLLDVGSNLCVGNRVYEMANAITAIRFNGFGHGVAVGNLVEGVIGTKGALTFWNGSMDTYDYMVTAGNLLSDGIVQQGTWGANLELDGDNLVDVPAE